MSNKFFNNLSSLALVCPISNNFNDFPLNVQLNNETKTTGAILCQHVKSLDLSARNATYIEKVPTELLEEVLEIIHSEL